MPQNVPPCPRSFNCLIASSQLHVLLTVVSTPQNECPGFTRAQNIQFSLKEIQGLKSCPNTGSLFSSQGICKSLFKWVSIFIYVFRNKVLNWKRVFSRTNSVNKVSSNQICAMLSKILRNTACLSGWREFHKLGSGGPSSKF